MTTIYQVCRDCATKLGWVPVPYAVGIWEGKCDLCKRTRPLCAQRDYRTKEGKHVTHNINSSISILSKMLDDPAILQSICKVADVITDCLEQGNTVAFCGNGGSAAQAQHFAAELMGRFLKNRKPYKAICLNSDVAVMTAIANDYTYEYVFSRQVAGLLTEGDCLVVLSTSGASQNCFEALYWANRMSLTTAAITGELGPKNRCWLAAKHRIAIPAVGSARIQEATLVIIHALCEIIESRLN